VISFIIFNRLTFAHEKLQILEKSSVPDHPALVIPNFIFVVYFLMLSL